MGIWNLLVTELKLLTQKKGVLLTIAGVLLIPIVYVAVLLSATWGPYDNLDNLPVAFVNKDSGAVSNGEPIHVGDDLVETLKESNTLGWHFVSEDEAKKGLDLQKYYMIVEIPEDFSRKVTTVLEENPESPELRYIQNEGLNFMAAQVTKSATERLREQLGDKITETYTRTLFSRFGDISNGFSTGADGSKQLYDGTTTLAEGTNELLTSLTGKSGDVKKLAAGAQTAENGAGQLLTSIRGGNGDIQKLANGAKQLADGTTSLQSGSSQVLSGLKSVQNGSDQILTGLKSAEGGANQVLTGIKDAKNGASQLTAGLESKLVPGATQVAEGVNQVEGAVAQLAPGANQLASGLEQLAAQVPGLAQSDQFKQLLAGSKQISAGLTGLNSTLPTLSAGADQVSTGLSQQVLPGVKSLDAGLSQLSAGQSQVAGGLTHLVDGQSTAKAGVDQLVAGQSQVVGGISKLQSGASQVAEGNRSLTFSWTKIDNAVSSLKTGLTQISDGNQTVATGWDTMTTGVTKLNNGAEQLKSGSEQLATGLSDGATQVNGIKVSDANIAMFASPVQLKGEKVNSYSFYRDSTAPYVLSLALFVGMLILSFFVDFKKPAVLPGSVVSWFMSKWMQLALFAVIQALIVSLFTLVVIRLDVSNIPLFIVFSILVSVAFMSIIFFLVSLGGHIGRFIGLAFIVLQLSTTGSNLPIPMLPENLQNLSKFLPLTYSNAGFKSVISLGDISSFTSNVNVLLIYLIATTILALIVFFVSFNSMKNSFTETEISS
ncbi:YhgE/Pip domain-containing protein [Lysinibacillus sp. 54212]|uniref:YhgE/Pip domain-containing protein n=1 Tax=Lysinibacillus sp. 54212 TaxID=3119829 RepID=UPI002FC9ED78